MIHSFVFFLLLISPAVYTCNLDPGDWCRSIENSKLCDVFSQCSDFNSRKLKIFGYPNNVAPLKLGFYYETLCPDCRNFFKNQLYPAFVKVPSIFKVDFVPYGNAREWREGKKWVFSCQHGEKECLGNMIHVCILMNFNYNDAFHVIDCMETKEGAVTTVAQICLKNQGFNWTVISECLSSKKSNQWQHQMARKTEHLIPTHTFVPWITLNDIHTVRIQQEAEEDLILLLCRNYKGKLPKECKKKLMWKKGRCKKLTGNRFL